MTSPSDGELVRRCLEGQEAAWRGLTERYADLVFGVARKAGLDADVAGDVVQEVFLALLSNLRRLRRVDRLLPWIVRTARREAWRQGRRGRSRRRREQAVARPEADRGRTPPEELAALELQHAVRQAFGSLDERCRLLLDALFGLERGVPYERIARDLGLAVGSIGSLRRRCLEELRAALEALGHSL